jgi:hypothetical protein
MQNRVSGIINSITATTTRQIGQLKGLQDETTARLASDTSALIGSGDPDQHGFLTAPFKSLRMMQFGNNSGVYGSMALMPQQQQASFANPYYRSGTSFVVDRAGSGNFGFNIARAGNLPDGYYGRDIVMVQKRFKVTTYGDENDPANPFFVYKVFARPEPKGYVLHSDERLDGNLYPGNIRQGLDPMFGNVFPFSDEGRLMYSTDPLGPDGWSGAVNVVPDNPDTKPVVTGITPSVFQLPVGDPGFEQNSPITINGHNFTGSGFAGIGPFFLNQYFGAPYPGPGSGTVGYQQNVGDTAIVINPPADMVAGVFDVYVVGMDGQIGVLENGFTVLVQV